MDRHTRIALLIVLGALLVTAQSIVPGRRDTERRDDASSSVISVPLDGEHEIIAFCELPAPANHEFRYCRVTAVGPDGVSRTVTLKAKKALVADSVRCSIKELLW